MSKQEISKRNIVRLSIIGCAIVLVLILLYPPLGFIFLEMILNPLTQDPVGEWLVIFAIMLPLLWWLWGPRNDEN